MVISLASKYEEFGANYGDCVAVSARWAHPLHINACPITGAFATEACKF